MEIKQNNSISEIKWTLYLTMSSALFFAVFEGFKINKDAYINEPEAFTNYLHSLIGYQAWFGIILIISSAAYPILKWLMRGGNSIRLDENISGMACLYGLLLLVVGGGCLEALELGFIGGGAWSLIIINALIFVFIVRPALTHVIYKMGLGWFVLSFLFVLFFFSKSQKDK